VTSRLFDTKLPTDSFATYLDLQRPHQQCSCFLVTLGAVFGVHRAPLAALTNEGAEDMEMELM